MEVRTRGLERWKVGICTVVKNGVVESTCKGGRWSKEVCEHKERGQKKMKMMVMMNKKKKKKHSYSPSFFDLLELNTTSLFRLYFSSYSYLSVATKT